MENAYNEIEKIYQSYFIKSPISYKDSIQLTHSIDAYGADVVLAALRTLYKQGIADEVGSAAYVDKVAKRLHGQKKDQAIKDKKAKKELLRFRQEEGRALNIPGYLAGEFRSKLKESRPDVFRAIVAYQKQGGEKPEEALREWKRQWEAFTANYKPLECERG